MVRFSCYDDDTRNVALRHGFRREIDFTRASQKLLGLFIAGGNTNHTRNSDGPSEESMKTNVKVGIIIVVLFAAAATVWTLVRNGSDGRVESATVGSPSLVKPQPGTVTVGIDAPAVLEPYRSIVIRSTVGGRLEYVSPTGSTVNEGEVVARFDPREADAKVARSRIDVAEAALSLDRSKRNFDKATTAFAESQELFAIGAVTRERLDAARDSLADAEHAVKSAELSLEKARLSLDVVLREREALVVRAPYPGVVVTAAVAPGDSVGANSTLITIADLSRLRVIAEIDEYDIVRIKTGMSAEVTVDAVSGRDGSPPSFSSVVDAISPTARIVSNISVFTVSAVIENETGSLRPGMTADLSVLIARDRGLVVPSRTVTTVRGRSYIDVFVDGEPETRRIEIGANDGVNVVVLEGLDENDRVVAPSTVGIEVLSVAPPTPETSSSVIPMSVPGTSSGGTSAGGGGGGGRQ